MNYLAKPPSQDERRVAIEATLMWLGVHKQLNRQMFTSEVAWAMREISLTRSGFIDWKRFELGRLFMRSLAEAQNWRCCYCDDPIEASTATDGRKGKSNTATFEHVIPLSRGGRDHPSNLVAACLGCNSRLGSANGGLILSPL